MSLHESLVVNVELSPHPNADSLSIVRVGGFQVCVRTADWAEKNKGIYITPDSIVDTTRPEFAFLNKGRQLERIKVVKLRGEYSQGLLIPCDENLEIGSDHFERLGLTWYEPELQFSTGGECVKGPQSWTNITKYDIESGRHNKYKNLFIDGERVYVSEKLHGAFCAYTYSEGQMFVRSRGQWKAEDNNIFWRGLRSDTNIEEFCKKHPDFLVCGEVYGQVQKGFRYDCQLGEVKFRCFDITKQNRSYLNYSEFITTTNMFNIPIVPNLGIIPFDYDKILSMAEGQSTIGDNIREGCVVKPLIERYDEKLGRVFIKIIGNGYLCN